MRTGSGVPIPLLTRVQNGIVDAALLLALAERALEGTGEVLTPEMREAIDALATSNDERSASRALVALVPPPILGSPTAIQQALAGDEVFTEIAGGLRDNTLLWLRVEGKPGDREVVRFSYDIPMKGRLGPLSSASFGLRPIRLRFGTPHLGTSGSYHLIISAPAPLIVTDGALVLAVPKTPHDPDRLDIVGSCTASEEDVEVAAAHPIQLYTKTFERDARFYVTGRRAGAIGRVYVSFLVERGGFIRGAAIASLAITLLLLAFVIGLGRILRVPEAAITLLLLAPALLAYLLVRPAEHTLVGPLLRGLRWVLLLVGLLPVAGAVAILLAGADANGRGLRETFLGLAALAGLASLILVSALVFPRGRDRRPFSDGKALGRGP
jgi:hypothetical protein